MAAAGRAWIIPALNNRAAEFGRQALHVSGAIHNAVNSGMTDSTLKVGAALVCAVLLLTAPRSDKPRKKTCGYDYPQSDLKVSSLWHEA